ncbi:hypothetical protein QYE76_022342 [Lolium multiflorum]|uniref:Uncharacterized protein n=1 Tax=Lolium multiflorum TaxID=4521 RepID=A0AAD8R9S3_LOLMU|nr:hypothetical protein QYE76_022342 [Lolium multiflorum]
MMAGATSDTAAAGAFAASGTSAKPRGGVGGCASACPRVAAAGGRRRCRVVHCDAGGDAQAVAKPASIPSLEQFKISADPCRIPSTLSPNRRTLSRNTPTIGAVCGKPAGTRSVIGISDHVIDISIDIFIGTAITNSGSWADGEDNVRRPRQRSDDEDDDQPKHDSGSRRDRHKRRKNRNYDDNNLVAAGYSDRHDDRSDNFRKEKIEFEVVNWESQYHDILGRPAYAKFMAVPHYAYLKLKMPGNKGTNITVHGSFSHSDSCDRDFQRIAAKFGSKQEIIKPPPKWLLREIKEEKGDRGSKKKPADLALKASISLGRSFAKASAVKGNNTFGYSASKSPVPFAIDSKPAEG